MAPKPFFNEDDAPRIENFLKEGLSYRQIALQFGCDHVTVSKFVRRQLPEWAERYNGRHTRPAGLRLLTIDIETKPGVCYFWDVREQYIPPERIISEKATFAFAAKWLGEDAVEFRSDFHDGHVDMVTRAHQLLSEADGVVTYNGARFDLPHLNLEFLRNGMKPPAPYKSVDLLQTIRRKFNFTSNRLQRVSEALGIGSKVEHEGFALWEKCMAGDKDAWSRMRAYNIQDVKLSEELYLDILPWIEQHPSYAAFTTDTVCPNCGSDELVEKGYYRTKTGTYRRYQCRCGKWVRDTRRSFRAEITETAMS